MKLDYKILSIFAIVILAIYAAGATGALSSLTVVSGDEEISLPSIIVYSNVENGYNAVTDTYTGGQTLRGEWLYGKFIASKDGFIKYSNVGDKFQNMNREDGNLRVQIAYADSTSSGGPGVIYIEMLRDSGESDVYFIQLADFDGSSHVKTFTLNKPLSYYDTSGDGGIKFNILHRAADANYINIYGVRLIMPLAAAADSCDGVSCPDKCEGTTRYVDGVCVDGDCKYTKIANSPYCGYDACDGVTCPDKCEGTTKLYSGTCVDGACEYQRYDDSVDCGWSASDPECEPYCDTDAHIKYYAGTYTNGVCTYETTENSVECGYEDPIDPDNPKDDDEVFLIGALMAGAVILLAAAFVGLKMRK